jgi:ABC-2 type transport system permease protein
VNTYWLETKYECLKMLRQPGRLAPLVLFPVVFYAFFGLSGKGIRGVNMATYLLGTYGVFGIMGASLMGIGSGLAVERGLGWMQVKRASPMPPASDLIAKIAAALMLGVIIVVLLLGLGYGFGGVHMPLGQVAALSATLIFGSVPFCALGVAIGYFAKAQSVHGIINLFYLPMAFCSGLWIPISMLPDFLQAAAPALPAYHLAQAALVILGQPASGSLMVHISALVGFTVLFAGVARYGYARDEARS